MSGFSESQEGSDSREVQAEDSDSREGQAEERGERTDDHFEHTYTLKSSEQYEASGYHYETDSRGRIAFAEGDLRLGEGKRNSAHQMRAGGEDRQEGDEGGHIFGAQFDGSEKIDNIVPMEHDVNRKEYRALEREWAQELKKGNKANVQVACEYEGDSKRPESVYAAYTIYDADGNYVRTSTKMIENR